MGHEPVTREASGIVCGPARYGDLPIGAMYVVGQTVEDVLQQWLTRSRIMVSLKAAGGGPSFMAPGPDARVVVIRVVERAVFVPAEGMDA